MNKKRSSQSILLSFLIECRKNTASKKKRAITKIMYKCNVSWQMMEKIIKYSKENGFIEILEISRKRREVISGKNTITAYHITEKGEELINKLINNLDIINTNYN